VYNRLFTIHSDHGLVLPDPIHPQRAGDFLLPLMIGARDLAFPASTWRLVRLHAWWADHLRTLLIGGVDTGWTSPPYGGEFSQTAVAITILGIFITGFSTIFTGLNFIVTTHKLRPGHDLMRLPLFVWSTTPPTDPGPARRASPSSQSQSNKYSAWGSSTRRSAATRCSSSTCSGSTPTRRSTS
jgi:heme/copper-type cytochrome/quinol oxidase subunit 1